MFHKINIHKRPQNHITFFFPLLFHLSLGQTLQFLQFVIQEDILSYLEV